MVWLLYAARVKGAGGSGSLTNPKSWPLLEMVFSTIAFAAWAYALPDSPFGDLAWYSAAVAAVVVLVVTVVLGPAAPLLRKPLTS